MIEIPEAVHVSGQAAKFLTGRKIARVTAGASPHKFVWYYGDPEGYAHVAAGRAITGAQAIGGMVELLAGRIRLLFSEGIGLRLHPDTGPVPKKHQLLVEFGDGSALSASAQMYGGVGIFREGENDNVYYRLSQEKPSPLTGAFDRRYFKGLLAGEGVEKLSAKAFLATEQRVPGLGNGVLQDILFNARIHPKTKIASLADERKVALFQSVKSTLKEMTRLGGRDVETDLLGNAGGYTTLMSRNTVGSPCAVCGTAIEKASYLGGSVYFCPSCQPV